MDFTLPQQNLVKTRADFSKPEFRKLIAQKGTRIEWSQSALCPCALKAEELNLDLSGIGAVEDTTSGHSTECPVCEGTGRYFHSPLVVQGVVMKAESEWKNERYAGVMDGTILVSLNPEHLATNGDRLKLIDSAMVFKELVVYKGGGLTSTRYPIIKRQMDLATGEVELGVVYASYTDSVSLLGTGVEVVEGVDFEVNTEGIIEWINAPVVGSRLTLSYYCNPTYNCIGFPHGVRDSRNMKKATTDYPITLPIQVEAQLDFLGR